MSTGGRWLKTERDGGQFVIPNGFKDQNFPPKKIYCYYYYNFLSLYFPQATAVCRCPLRARVRPKSSARTTRTARWTSRIGRPSPGTTSWTLSSPTIRWTVRRTRSRWRAKAATVSVRRSNGDERRCRSPRWAATASSRSRCPVRMTVPTLSVFSWVLEKRFIKLQNNNKILPNAAKIHLYSSTNYKTHY